MLRHPLWYPSTAMKKHSDVNRHQISADEMTPKPCWKCGKRTDFDGQVEGIRRTICCESCCLWFTESAPHQYAGIHRMTEKRAVNEYHCTRDDLDTIANCVMLHYPRNNTSRLFLGAEIICLAERRTKAKWKKQLKKKYADIQRRLGVRLKKLDPTMRAFLLDDYACRWGDPKTTMEDIEKRLRVLHRVQIIRKRCERAHPKAVFDFCLSNPDAEPEEFLDLRSKVKRVMRLESDRIMKHLTQVQRNELMDTPLKDCAEQYASRDKKPTIRSHLQEMGVSEDEAKEIVDHSACQLRIEREDSEKRAAGLLLRFWREKDDIYKRERKLIIAGHRGLGGPMHPSSTPYQMYLNGDVDADLEELTSHMYIAKDCNFPFESKHRDERISIAFARFEDCLYRQKMELCASIVEAVTYGQRVLLPDAEDVRETFDYKQLANGFWSDRWDML